MPQRTLGPDPLALSARRHTDPRNQIMSSWASQAQINQEKKQMNKSKAQVYRIARIAAVGLLFAGATITTARAQETQTHPFSTFPMRSLQQATSGESGPPIILGANVNISN